MPEIDFHFLRPWWLLFVPYALWLHLRLRRAYSATFQWQGAIAPELLEHLTLAGPALRRLRPYQLMTVSNLMMALLVAGPTWDREVTPFTQDRAPLVIAIELTPSMLGTDTQPTRLERARQKIRDLLEQRRGARTAVLGYAGSAHQLLPFTDDTDLLEVYLEALHPNLMPNLGDSPTLALKLAEGLLAGEEVSGTVLFLTDGIDRSEADDFADFVERSGDQIILLGFGGAEGGPIDDRDLDLDGMRGNVGESLAPPIDLPGLEAVASASGGRLILATIENDDVGSLNRLLRSHLVDAFAQNDALAWHDRGYPLAWGIAFCMLFWFRRGWTVQWRL
jgi:Ca-activated chloride channel family protein